jgi:HAD superfamily hydrolase (TIGR01450 family)
MTEASGLLEDVDALVCDLDGVIYRGSEPIAGSPEAVASLRGLGLKVLFCTNNARPTISEYTERLERMGIPCSAEELITSSIVAAEEIALEHPGARVVVVGGEGLHEALIDRGLVVVDAGADAVVVGMTPAFDYEDMARASSAIRSGAAFYATNDDATFPAEEGLRPGARAMGWVTVLVLSGVTSEAQARGLNPQPDLVVPSLRALVEDQ